MSENHQKFPQLTGCDLFRIEQFLNQQLDDTGQASFEAHLETCETCRQELERQAAREDIWRDARESLSTPDPSRGIASRLLPEAGAGRPVSAEAASVDPVDGGAGGEETRDWSAQAQRLLSPTDDPRMLGRFGPYEIAGVIGQGGMGVVFKGFDPSLNRYVAIKVLLPHLAEGGAARKRFAREAKAAAAVVHENVVAIHGVAEWNGLPYLVMPYVRGESLQKRVGRDGPLDVLEVLRIGRQIAAGLAAAHAQGLVHRDIKPANILLEQGVERLKITDFGLARAVDDGSVTRTGMIAGTPQYMSPEQACGDAIDARSDLFSLGSVLYFLCTGRPPFRAETSYGVLRKITDSEPRPIREISPAIPDWLAALIKKLHAKQPGDRQGSAEEVTEVLEQCLSHCQQPTVVPLPNAVRLLVVAGENTAAEANQQGGAADASVRKPVVVSSARERRSRIQRIAIGAAVVLIGCAATVNWWHQGLKEEGTRGSSAGQSADAALRGRPEDPAKSTALWDDGAIERIIELQGEIDDVERRGLPLWDPVPDQSLKGE